MKHWLFALFLLPLAVLAQDEMPAVNTESPAVNTESPSVNTESPAVTTTNPSAGAAPAVPRPATRARAQGSSAVVGEQETPLGLYIMPWRNSAAATGLDRPARFLRESLVPVDEEVFGRQIEFFRALTAHLEKTGRDTP